MRDQTLTERFEAFHAANPAFYGQLVHLTRRFRDRTGRRCGIQRIIEVARFDVAIQTQTDEDFKVNNDFAAFYARLIMHQEADLVGFFELRRSAEADIWIALVKHGVAA